MIHDELQSLINEFHRWWDHFPGMARLIDRNHNVLAANAAARERGFEPGVVCAKVGNPASHQGCLMHRMLAEGKAQWDRPKPDRVRAWIPVEGRNDVFVHTTFYLNKE